MKNLPNQALVGVFLIVYGSMLLTIKSYGISIPYYDEWESEANWLYRLYEEGRLGFGELSTPHNGHIIIITRLVSLLLYILNSGWDPQLQMIVNAFLHAAICTILVKYYLTYSKNVDLIILHIFTIILFAIPFSWVSITVAFQTQFYFMVIFSILALRYLSSSRYLIGYFFSVLAILSMSPGALLLPAYAISSATLLFNKYSFEKTFHAILSALFFIILIIILPEEPSTIAYHADSIGSFLTTIISAFSWPYKISLGIGLVIYIPLLVYVIRNALTKFSSTFIFSLGVFILLQFIAMAYFRGGDGVPPANRYWEIMLVGIWLNAICLKELSDSLRNAKFFRYSASLWIIIVSIGMSTIAYQSFTKGLPDRMNNSLTAKSLILEYFETGNKELIYGRTTSEISHANPDALILYLDDPSIRSLLPSALGGNSNDQLRDIKFFLFSMAPVFILLGIFLTFNYIRISLKSSD